MRHTKFLHRAFKMAAKMADKMAGGIFYTLDEHGRVLEKLRSLEREVDALREENASRAA